MPTLQKEFKHIPGMESASDLGTTISGTKGTLKKHDTINLWFLSVSRLPGNSHTR